MNVLLPEEIASMFAMFEVGTGVRKIARQWQIDRKTVTRYRNPWRKALLQEAYDVMWEGDGEGCDALLNNRVSQREASSMLDDWLDDTDEKRKRKSHWYTWD